MDLKTWTQTFSEWFEDFKHKCSTGRHIGIDCYAASSPAEFFAVFSEVFFERPDLLRRHYTKVFEQLRLYYRQDPLTRMRQGE